MAASAPASPNGNHRIDTNWLCSRLGRITASTSHEQLDDCAQVVGDGISNLSNERQTAGATGMPAVADAILAAVGRQASTGYNYAAYTFYMHLHDLQGARWLTCRSDDRLLPMLHALSRPVQGTGPYDAHAQSVVAHMGQWLSRNGHGLQHALHDDVRTWFKDEVAAAKRDPVQAPVFARHLADHLIANRPDGHIEDHLQDFGLLAGDDAHREYWRRFPAGMSAEDLRQEMPVYWRQHFAPQANGH